MTTQPQEAIVKKPKPFLQALEETTKNVLNTVEDYTKDSKITLPKNYSAGNALNQFMLKIQDEPKIQECTIASIQKCMLDMVILGLNITKSQCYVIPYDRKATLSVSYMGKVAIAKRINPNIKDIFARTIHKGDDFEFVDSPNGYSIITKHNRSLESMSNSEIIGAYATIIFYNDEEPQSLIMTYDRILKSWAMSQAKPFDDKGNLKKGTAHDKFTDEMAQRTVINAICKPIINNSSDADLFGITIQSVDLNDKASSTKEFAKSKMSTGEFIDVDFGDEIDNVETDYDDSSETETDVVNEQTIIGNVNPETGEVI